MRYSSAFRNNVIRKVIPPENRPVGEVSKEYGVSVQTIQNWLEKLKDGTLEKDGVELSPGSRSVQERFRILMESKSIPEAEFGEWLRRNGLHSEHLSLWEQELNMLINDKTDKTVARIKELEQENKRLKKELYRKEKALAETAALLTLKKKANAIWGDGEDD
jgi:transposase